MGIFSKIKAVWLYVGYVVILLVVLECANRAVFYFRYTSPQATRDPRLDISVFKNVDWAEEYFKEHKAMAFTYESYVGWRVKASKGKFINVSPEGVRKTWNPPDLDRSKAKLVYCFGGSVLWGTGSRDDYTIPSFVSKFLNKEEERYYVINHGQGGYSLFQEVIYLISLIKDNKVPDYVLFFDGVNDIHSAYANNRAGEAADFTVKREQLQYDGEIKSNRDYLKKFIRGFIDARINAYAFTSELRRKWRAQRRWQELGDEEKMRTGAMSVEDRDEQQLLSLANDVVDNYFGLTDIVRALAARYGFKVAFFWQPMTGANLSSSKEEDGFTSQLGEKRLEFNRLVYKIVDGKKDQKDFYDLQRIFQSKDKNVTVFVDYCHLSEFANSIIAEKMVNILRSEMMR